MQKLYTYETELKPKHNQEIIDYFNDCTTLFNKIVRNVWQYYNHQDTLIGLTLIVLFVTIHCLIIDNLSESLSIEAVSNLPS